MYAPGAVMVNGHLPILVTLGAACAGVPTTRPIGSAANRASLQTFRFISLSSAAAVRQHGQLMLGRCAVVKVLLVGGWGRPRKPGSARLIGFPEGVARPGVGVTAGV